MASLVLRDRPTPEDDAWDFRIALPPLTRTGMGLHVSFSPEKITLDRTLFPQNRILQNDDLSQFVLVSFEKLRFPDTSPRVAQEYMLRFFKAGLLLNGAQYRFYGHSNSQLRSRSCFLRRAETDEELDNRIYALGDFLKIPSAAKRAKRIGLLFSEAKLDWILDPQHTKDIGDIEQNGEVFSDGCGLISIKFAKQLSKHKRILYHGRPYTPTVYQIRYRGYKGVLMLEPRLTNDHVHFRKSQKKFTATQNNTFSIVDHSVPFAFGRLNNDIVVLLSSLGISTETFLAKQRAYHDWLQKASDQWEAAFDLLCASGRYAVAERLLLEGADAKAIRREVRAVQNSELAALRKNDRLRVRTLVPASRLLFGVCDPYGVLAPGEVHVRVMVPRKGPTTLANVDVLVVRNPCLYPGDCLKLRAVYRPELQHLVDCVVFASRGRRAAPSMSSGGDLDGDKFTVIWDRDLVPSVVAQPYDYPAPPERPNTKITRQDLAKHFAAYNSITMGRVAALHAKWVRLSPAGAMCAECQELNALYSLAVDGGSVKIPDRLVKVPKKETDEPYVLEVLHDAARAFAEGFHQAADPTEAIGVDGGITLEVAEDMVSRLMSSEHATMSEYEILCKAASIARKYNIDMRRYFGHIDFGGLSVAEKYAAIDMLNLTDEEIPYVWNSLVRSEILRRKDLESRELGGPLRLQRLYSSSIQGRAAFFEYLKEALQNYNRRMVIMKTDHRFSAGIFFRGPIPWDEDFVIGDNVLACSFLPESSKVISTYKRGVKGWTLSCNDNTVQLFNGQRQNTFIFITRPPAQSGSDIITSIALQNFSRFVQQQYGRMNREPVTSLEIHVVSNRDRVAHQLFDLRFDYVETRETLHRFDHRPGQYIPNSLLSVNWDEHTPEERTVLIGTPAAASQVLDDTDPEETMRYFFTARKHRAEDRMFHIFEALLRKPELPLESVLLAMAEHPPLAYCVLKRFLHEGATSASTLTEPVRARLAIAVLTETVRSANELGMAALAALERLAADIAALDLSVYLNLLWLAVHSVRSFQLVQEILLVLQDSRMSADQAPAAETYAHKHALAVMFDRAEEAANDCPCDDQGRPRRQRDAPIATKLLPMPPPKEEVDGQANVEPQAEAEELSTPVRVMAHVRVDLSVPIRLHAHVRLKVASTPEHSTLPPAIVDALVVRASRGELVLDVLQPLPPEFASVDWQMYPAGGVVTSKAMLEAIRRLAVEGRECCRFKDIIFSEPGARVEDDTVAIPAEQEADLALTSPLNDSQKAAVAATALGRMSLIWGPPGTGKTTVVVQILIRFLRLDPEATILMTASTHNAVDNVLERFVAENEKISLLQDEEILRAATEVSRVNKALQKYTVDAKLGGNLNENPRLVQKAQKRVKDARIVFTTCTGASLGILRKANFDIVLIDEASQISEPAALIPLVKGSGTAVMVGDHVQLRPTVQAMGKALEFDRSLFERLYIGSSYGDMTRNMLEVQYRFPKAIAGFPSAEFYEGRLATGNPNTHAVAKLSLSRFPWPGPERDGNVFPVVFVPCLAEEDYGRSSKSNKGQAELVKYIISLLRGLHLPEQRSHASVSPEENRAKVDAELQAFSIAALTPYSRQVQLLRHTLPSGTVISTIDGFQGRESDIVVFSTVRSNADGDLGFVEDARRLNVAWTRPKVGLIIVGDPRTLKQSALWGRALKHCREVNIPPLELPEAGNTTM